MIEELTQDTSEEAKRKSHWDRFLDAYSQYLRDRTLPNAALLRLAGIELEKIDAGFSMREFQKNLGWDLEEQGW
ncbi:MAG: hypothetical protein PVF43_10100 [Candidatus Eiseniibacteriota bacterium]